MDGQLQPTPQPTPAPQPAAPTAPAPTPAPQPVEPQPTPQPAAPAPEPAPQGGAKGEPDEYQKMRREILEEVKGMLPKNEPAEPAPAEPNLDEINAQHQAQAKSWAIERELLKGGCVDTDALMVHIKTDDVKLAEDSKSITEGLDMEALKKSYPYLFPQPTQTPQTVSTSANPGGAAMPTEAKNIKQGLEMRKQTKE